MGLIDVSVKKGVTLVRFNNAKKLNAWSTTLLKEKRDVFASLAADNNVDAVILTGTGNYYSAGVDLANVLKPMMPKTLVDTIETLNRGLFEQFIDFPKPIFAAVNGPTIGAAVTSATLTDGIIANQRATFVTPFKALGLVPEGCSSYLFPKIFGDELAQKLLVEGYKLNAQEAHKYGMVSKMVETPDFEAEDPVLVDYAHEFAQAYLADHGRKRSRSAEETAKLKAVNAKESRALAEAFLSEEFFRAMEANAARKGKSSVENSFKALRLTKPLWSILL